MRTMSGTKNDANLAEKSEIERFAVERKIKRVKGQVFPKEIQITYEWDGVCWDLDVALRKALAELGYENPDSGFMFPDNKDDLGVRDLSFVLKKKSGKK